LVARGVLLPAPDAGAQELVDAKFDGRRFPQMQADCWGDGAPTCLPTRCDASWHSWTAYDRAV